MKPGRVEETVKRFGICRKHAIEQVFGLKKDIGRPVVSFVCSLSVIAFGFSVSSPLSIIFPPPPSLISFFSHTHLSAIYNQLPSIRI